ncbi:MAG: ferritin-like domain-containing protein [Alphaproteobacteria bacterium]|nr:ferritin-like domain-containing protein [Alphaproteobacteria bacterium]MBV9554008.1 ferritin-like domain-containing protein [Alphaproteobacteria bacterium]
MSSPAPTLIASAAAAQPRWSLDDIDWGSLRPSAVAESETTFYLVAAASFIEATTDLYTKNLIEYFSDDAEITEWLAAHWLPEELQHGRALRRYVELAWPDFDWDGVYRRFLPEFAAQCADDGVEPTRSREMASRCIVEMGTASYYRMLSQLTDDPLLTRLTRQISDDEVNHYKHFYRYLRKYQAREGQRRSGIARALWNRLMMIDGNDTRIAMRHIYRARHPEGSFDERIFRRLRRAARVVIRPHFPHRMCVQMLLRPLDLPRPAQRIARPALEAVARRIVP